MSLSIWQSSELTTSRVSPLQYFLFALHHHFLHQPGALCGGRHSTTRALRALHHAPARPGRAGIIRYTETIGGRTARFCRQGNSPVNRRRKNRIVGTLGAGTVSILRGICKAIDLRPMSRRTIFLLFFSDYATIFFRFSNGRRVRATGCATAARSIVPQSINRPSSIATRLSWGQSMRSCCKSSRNNVEGSKQ